MTTKAAEELYLAQHRCANERRTPAISNPHRMPVEQLPVIYGFNNGGPPGWMSAVLLAEDGKYLGGHVCSHEGYMESDLGVLEGTRPDRHKTFRKHYPGGYRMEFVASDKIESHEGLQAAITKANAMVHESEGDG